MIPTAIREYIKPTSIQEAWAVLMERGLSAKPMGGGIDVGLYATPDLRIVVDLGGLELSYVRGEDELDIGATTTFAEMIESSRVGGYLDGILVEILEKVASPLQRNLATVGGTLGSAHPWSDVIPALLALDAQVVVYHERRQTLPLAEYFAIRAQGERPLITEIRLPRAPVMSACGFEEYSKTAFDVAILNCACFVELEADRCKTARIAIGGTPAMAARRPTVEESLTGARLDGEAIDRVAEIAERSIDARDDRRATAAYRRHLARVGVSRCLRRIARKLETMG